MSRTHFFGHTHTDAAVPGTPFFTRLRDFGHHVTDSVFVQHAALCSVCHAELQPHEFATGYCADQDACCMRRYSQRCW